MLELNKAMLVGRLTRDPEIRYLQTGSSVANFTVAVGRRYRDSKTNEYVEETAFVPVATWNKQAEFVEQFFKKGMAIYVEGRIQQDNWEMEGQKFSRLVLNAERVKFAETRAESEARRASAEAPMPGPAPAERGQPAQGPAPSSLPPMPGAGEAEPAVTDDDLPF